MKNFYLLFASLFIGFLALGLPNYTAKILEKKAEVKKQSPSPHRKSGKASKKAMLFDLI